VAIQNGQLAARGKTKGYSGGWRNLIEGVHDVIDAFVNPITVTATALARISEGEIPEKITAEYQGDFKNIQEDLNTMIITLEQFTTEIRMAADQVASGSQILSVSAEQISQGASQQAATAEEITSTMEQIAANIRQNADNATQTASVALHAADDARQSGKAVDQTIQAIKGIARTIKVIEKIAQQTHMLSLNATIEAAKAEEHGRGFAVVAAEVRSLARRSQEAAEEINQLASSSVTIAENAGTMLGHLVPTIENTSSLVQEISAASNEQTLGVEQINKAMQQLDLVIQQNAATSEETAATAETLLQQSEQLQNVAAFFHRSESTVTEIPTEEQELQEATDHDRIPPSRRAAGDTRKKAADAEPKWGIDISRKESYFSHEDKWEQEFERY
jgi:methyl-accepting chemotaxis protein